ncbi:DUF7522 family protein [Halorussus halobius]|uniref:DUF7522 family protein n=1 Tax=Halorussus halobius TaxID=1710537 RepID=UPI0010927D18|nr:hypothetical protein [Halorussus halobius]
MSEKPAEALTEFLRERVGDHLRSVVRYDEDGAELVYVRDDVAERYSTAATERVFQDVRLEGMGKPHQEGLYDHGSLNCTVRSFDDAVEMHFPHDETTGVAVSLDGEVFAINNTFIGECLERAQE